MQRRVVIFWGLFVAIAFFRVWGTLDFRAPGNDCLKKAVSGIGTVTEEPSRTETGQVFVVRVELLTAPGNLNAPKAGKSPSSSATSSTGSVDSKVPPDIKCPTDQLIRLKTKLYPRFQYNDAVSFTGNLSKPFNFSGNTGRQFDYVGYLAKDDVYYEIKSAKVTAFILDELQATSGTENFQFSVFNTQLSIPGTGIIVIQLQSLSPRISSTLFSLRRGFVANINRVLGEPHAALAAGLVVGEKSALGNDLLNDFRTVGLIHIVVLSGFNITIVADAIRRLLSRLPRVWGITIGAVGLAMFGVMVGGGATVVRSCFMAGIALSADLIRRDYNVVRALMFAGLLMLIQSPVIFLHDPSFQLSFLATLGLVMLAGPIESKLGFLPDMFGLRGIIASTLATQIFVSPYILYMMGQISVIGALVNILVLSFIPITMLAVFLAGASGFISSIVSQWFGYAAHLLLSYELFMVEYFAKFPWAAFKVPPFSIWWVAGFYAAFTAGFLAVKR